MRPNVCVFVSQNILATLYVCLHFYLANYREINQTCIQIYVELISVKHSKNFHISLNISARVCKPILHKLSIVILSNN